MHENSPLDFRRKFLKGGISASLLVPFLGAGLLQPTRLFAAEWQRQAFSAGTIGEALKACGSASTTETRNIVINAPEIAENGAKVDIEIICNLAGCRSLVVLADKNPTPLCGILEFSDTVLPYARLQLKLAESSRIRAVARTLDGKSHVAFKEVNVTLGGCGG